MKLRSALRWLKKLGITGILQGDLLFTQGDLKKETIDGQKYITFQPNTIKYAVPSESALARKMSTAQVGIVFHTAYTGDSIQNLTAVFNPSLSNLSPRNFLLKQCKEDFIDSLYPTFQIDN